MQTVLRALRLLVMVAWVGGLIFFAFVLAPTAFHVLPSVHEAGLIVGRTLPKLHWIGLAGGSAFCLATAWLWLRAEVPARVSFAIQFALTSIMLAMTAYSQFGILPRMERDRIAAGGDIDAAPATDPGRVDFERLHVLSERLEGAVLFCGLGIVYLLSRESQWPESGKVRVL